jgi:transposase
MYISEVLTKTKKGKVSHRCILLRESYRENGKVRNRTIANLTHCNPEEVEALRLALKHKDNLTVLKSFEDIEVKQGLSIGAVWLVYNVAKQLGIEKALGNDVDGKLALWQVIARVIDHGSRLQAVRLAQTHAACDILGINESFNEDDLYKNLDWLSDNQKRVEKYLFKLRYKNNNNDKRDSELFLYDVTSSYFEGLHNTLADWGYNRDKKTGKKQVVVGLLCNGEGDPISIEVFTGNTHDFNTVASQIKKVAVEFGCTGVTFVGDRGMIKSEQIEALEDEEFHYITAITKPQIDRLLKKGIFQMELFDKDICEVEYDNVRYILRRNPYRAEEISNIRKEKRQAIEILLNKKNIYLSEHPRANVDVAKRVIVEKIEALKLDTWLTVEINGRTLQLKEDKEHLSEETKLDGCYVIKSDLPKDIDKQIIHDRYKDLAHVEQAFKTCKTALLELRPWYVQTEDSTRGHAFVVMLAYLITHHLQKIWSKFNITVEEGLKELTTLCSVEIFLKDGGSYLRIPTPRPSSINLLKSANVSLPKVLPHLNATVVTRKKLQTRRKG